MEKIVAWVVDNKDWLFNGAGALLIFSIIGWVARLIFKKMSARPTQTIRSGDSSTNIQAGRDVNVKTKKKGNYVGED